MEIHPTKHLTELRLVSLLSQHKLSLKESLRNFPQGHASLLNDSKDHERQDILEKIGNYDPDDNVALVNDYEQVLRQLDNKLGSSQYQRSKKVRATAGSQDPAVSNNRKKMATMLKRKQDAGGGSIDTGESVGDICAFHGTSSVDSNMVIELEGSRKHLHGVDRVRDPNSIESPRMQ